MSVWLLNTIILVIPGVLSNADSITGIRRGRSDSSRVGTATGSRPRLPLTQMATSQKWPPPTDRCDQYAVPGAACSRHHRGRGVNLPPAFSGKLRCLPPLPHLLGNGQQAGALRRDSTGRQAHKAHRIPVCTYSARGYVYRYTDSQNISTHPPPAPPTSSLVGPPAPLSTISKG